MASATIDQARDLAHAVRALVRRACEDFSVETGATIEVTCRPIMAQTMSETSPRCVGYDARVEVRIP